MIKRVAFANWKGLRQVELELGRLTAIVGPNASGKTSILKGLQALSQLAVATPNEVFGAERPNLLDEIVPREAVGTSLEVEGSWGPGDDQVGFTFAADRPAAQGAAWSYSASASGTRAWETGGPDEPYHPLVKKWPDLALRIASAAFLRLDAAALAAPATTNDVFPRLGEDGHELAAVLEDLASNDPEGRKSLEASVRKVVPAFKQFRIQRVNVPKTVIELVVLPDQTAVERPVTRTVPGRALRLDVEGAADIAARQASEGTLLVLGLLAVLRQKVAPRLLLVDDLDRGLHPRGQLELVRILKAILEEHPLLQIVATTHSPYVLDALEPHDVYATDSRPDGSVACARLDQHPDFMRWKKDMSAGEFWSHVQEGWVKELPMSGSTP